MLNAVHFNKFPDLKLILQGSLESFGFGLNCYWAILITSEIQLKSYFIIKITFTNINVIIWICNVWNQSKLNSLQVLLLYWHYYGHFSILQCSFGLYQKHQKMIGCSKIWIFKQLFADMLRSRNVNFTQERLWRIDKLIKITAVNN